MVITNTLTTQEKFMNMAKVGIVLRFGKDCANLSNLVTTGLGGLMAYTLCEVDDELCRNGNRHGLVFYIPLIIGRSSSLPSTQNDTGVSMDACADSAHRDYRYGLSNTVPLSHFEISDSSLNSSQTLSGSGLRPDLPTTRNYSTFLRRSASATLRAARSPRVGVMPTQGHADTYPTQAGLREAAPFMQNQQAPEVRAVGSSLTGKPARKRAGNARITKLVITELVIGKVTSSVMGRQS